MSETLFSLGAHLRRAATELGSRLEAEILLAHALHKNRAWLYAHPDQMLEASHAATLKNLVERRCAGEPVAYLIGMREFYGREFLVTPDVLIPRPETEHLVERALDLHLPSTARVVDVGTGSGCIGLTLAAERPAWQVLALDLCPQALTVAHRNRQRLGLERVSLAESDLLSALTSRDYDLVVSNPPYVAAGDPHLERGDLRFEPAIALSCDDGGLALIRKLAAQASTRLKPGGWLLVEHGHEQGASVSELFRCAGFNQIETSLDLAGLPRLTAGQLP